MGNSIRKAVWRRWSAAVAPIMFALALAFLVGLATLVVYLVDMPGLRERIVETAGHPEPAVADAGDNPSVLASIAQWTLLAIWPLFWIEWLVLAWAAPTPMPRRARRIRGFLCAACPPLRLCARNALVGDAIWFPYWGWRAVDDQLRRGLVRAFGIPMLGIAIMILPVLGVELLMQDQVVRYPWLRAGLHFSTGLIWFAFTVEFIVMISVAERKFAYCKQHWIDLAIILLPLISFLRSLQVLRATRLANFTKVQQMSKLARAYRLRGVSAKAMRAFVLLDLAGRVLRRSPEKRIAHLRREHARLSMELREIEQQIESLAAEQGPAEPGHIELGRTDRLA